jgi:hypothetical protein
MTRRSFLFLAGAGTAGLLVAPPSLVVVEPWEVPQMVYHHGHPSFGMLVAEAWNKAIGERPEDNLFSDRAFGRAMRTIMRARLNVKD